VSEESYALTFRVIDTSSRPTPSLKKVRFHNLKKSAFQFGTVSSIVEYPPAGQDSFCRAFELRHDPSGRDDSVRRVGYNSVPLAMYAPCGRRSQRWFDTG